MFKKVFATILCFIMAVGMSFTAFAAEFTPSVSAKSAPTVVGFSASNGTKYAAAIYGSDGKLIKNVPEGNLIITPYSKMNSAQNSQIKNNLQSSYNQIQAANSFVDLCPGVAGAVKAYSASINVNNLVAKDLFDVSVTGEYADLLNQAGNYIEIKFNLSASSDALASVLQYVNGEWVAISPANIIRNGFEVTLRLDNAGSVVFLYDKDVLPDADPNAPKSPNTGEMSMTAQSIAGVVGVAVLVLGAAAAVKSRKLRAER